jgi:cytochrome c peroxidase
MGGSGLQPTDEQHVAQFIVGAATPDNPFRGAALNAQQQRGAQIFQSAACGSCHTGVAMTNNGFANVGTLSTSTTINEGTTIASTVAPDDFSQMPTGLNVPSLLQVGRTAPYLHSGAEPTLKARIMKDVGTNQHGNLAQVSAQDVDDLVSFLKTL